MYYMDASPNVSRNGDMLLTKLTDYASTARSCGVKANNSHLNINDVSLRKILLVDHMRALSIKFIPYNSYFYDRMVLTAENGSHLMYHLNNRTCLNDYWRKSAF